MMLLLLACTAEPPGKDEGALDSDPLESAPGDSVPRDSAAPDSSNLDTAPAEMGETGVVEQPCAGEPDPDRDVTFDGLFGRLADQGCLHEADQALILAFVDAFYENEPVWCDAVWRMRSDDGLVFAGGAERVREHASVPDVWIDASGAHTLLYNDLSPGAFARVLSEDPADFWRRGLVGLGGLGAMVDEGDGFTEIPLDLALPELSIVVDPDLSRVDGAWRVVSFQVGWSEFDGGSFDPYGTAPPHDFHRAAGGALDALSDTLVVSAAMEPQGGADPTVLDLSGEEILFVGDFFGPMEGWVAPGGVYGSADAPPDVHTGIAGAAPDAIEAPDGGYRLYFRDPVGTELRVATSEDGRTWTIVGEVSFDQPELNNPSLARDPDGGWWLYYSQRDADCMRGVEAEMARAR